MNDETAKQWFIRTITRDLFIIYSVTWVLLFLLESVKPGLVSNYLSLPHLAALLVALGVVALVFQPLVPLGASYALSKRDYLVLIVLSIVAALLIIILVDVGLALTLLLVFVTVATIWVGTIMLQEDD